MLLVFFFISKLKMILLLTSIVILLLSIFYYKFFYKPQQYWKEKGIPYEEPVPIFGNLWPFISKKLTYPEWLRTLYKKQKDHRYFGIYQFAEPILVLRDLDLIKQIGIKDFEHFVDHKDFFSGSQEPVFSLNLFSLKGQQWKDMRATLSPTFTGSKMRAMYTLMTDCARQFVKHFENQASSPNEPVVLQMKDVFIRYSSDVIATCAFGLEVDSLKDRENDFFINGQDVSDFGSRELKFLGFNFFPKLMNFFKVRLFSAELINYFRNIVVTTTEMREKHNIYRPDMIHLLMEAQKGKLKHEEKSIVDDAGFAVAEESNIGRTITNNLKLTEDDLTAQVLLFFIAGFETSSTTSSFLAYELALNQDIQKRLQEEIDEVMESHDGKINYETLMNLKYLDMVICETLRKWPIVSALTRICNKPYVIEPKYPGETRLELQVGDLIWLPNACTQMDPEYYSNPEVFDPERFNDENRKNINTSAYLPFGIGPRNCIGSRFALLKIKTLIVHLLSNFDIVVVEQTQTPVKIAKGQFLVASEDGIMLGFKKRNKN